MSFIKEFKEFAMKGNVIDLAVGVIIGGAFGAIVNSLVKDVLMPLFGILVGKIDFSKLSAKVGDAEIRYGAFIQAAVNFLIIAFVIFLFIKAINRMKKKQETAPASPPAPTLLEKLLMEIRDLLKK